jgi:hypothetical protein
VKLTRGVLAREEAAGHIAADLLGIEQFFFELLKEEALPLGESVRKAALAANNAEMQKKNVASAKKSKLKLKTTKDPVVAARLAKELQHLDSELETARAELQQTEITLNGLPDATTAIVECRAPKPAEPAVPEPVRAE